MKATKYRFTINGKTYHGYGYAETRCKAILDNVSQGFGFEVTLAERFSEHYGWIKTANDKV